MILMQAQDISLTRGGRKVVDAASLTLEAGRVMGLIGPNGAGKSTALRMLAGLLTPDCGHVRLQDRDIGRIGAEMRARQVAFIPQDGQKPPPMPVRALVALGRLPHGQAGERAAGHPVVEDALAATDMLELQNRPASHLSGDSPLL